MHLFRTYHHHHIHRSVKTEFWLFELSVWLHVLGRSVVAIFIPILLLQLDYSVREVVVYYLIYHIFDIPLNFVARRLVATIGARNVIIAATVFVFFFFFVLYNLQPSAWGQLMYLALLAALYDAFYWVAHIYYFIEASKKRHTAAKDTSLLYIVRRGAGILAPAFGAGVLIFFNQQVLIAISMFIMALSVIPLFFMRGVHDRPEKPFLRAGPFFKKTKTIRTYLAYGLYSLHADVEDIMWPMFIYVALESIESVAAVPIIVSITTIIFTFLTGRIARKNPIRIVALGGLFIGVVWLLRLWVDSSVFYYISVALVGLFSVFVSLPTESDMYEKGERVDSLTTATYRNVTCMSFHLILYALLAIVLHVFQVSFSFAALSMFLIVPVIYLFHRSFEHTATST